MAKKSKTTGLRAEFVRALVLVGLSSALGLCINAFSAHPLAIFSEEKKAEAPPEKPTPMSIAEYAAAMRNKEALLLLDVRGTDDFEAEHPAFALNVPLSTLPGAYAEIAPMLEGASTVVTMCDGQECHKAEKAAGLLVKLGVKNVRYLTGGYEAYHQAGLPVKTGKN